MNRKRHHNRRCAKAGAAGVAVLAMASGAAAVPITLTGSYAQDFNTLASTGTSSTLPAGWAFVEGGSNQNLLYNTSTGSNTAGDTYSFGAASNAERAFGTLFSGSLNSIIGAEFVNNTGQTITSLDFSYVGEQWRRGNTTAGAADRLRFDISTNATSLTTGTYTNVAALDFTSVNTGASVAVLDGNVAGNRAAIAQTVGSLTIPDGSTFWVRWVDTDLAPGADDGLAVDDFSITPSGFAPPPPPPPPGASPLLITGIVDGPLPNGSPKFIELFATGNIANLNAFSLERYANGGLTPTPQTLPGVALNAGEFIYLVQDAAALADFNLLFPGKNAVVFGLASGNGDDAFQLLQGGSAVDLFGSIGIDGTGEPWDYEDSFAFRLDGFGPNTTFTLSEWFFGGANALDAFGPTPADPQGLAARLTPFIMQYTAATAAAVVPEPMAFSLIVLGSTALLVRRRRAA